MHELGIMTGVIEAVDSAARAHNATKVLKVSLSVGVMTEAIEDALRFAFEALSEQAPLFQGAELEITMVQPRSRCVDCGLEFDHDRYHVTCLRFAFEALSEQAPLFQGAELEITMVQPRSRCVDCGLEFDHDRYHVTCPSCGGFAELIAGKELAIDSVEVDLPDESEE